MRQADHHLRLKSDVHAWRPGIAADAAILVTPSFFLEANIGAAILHFTAFTGTARVDLELGSALVHHLADLLSEGFERQVFKGNVGIVMTGHWRTPRHPALLALNSPDSLMVLRACENIERRRESVSWCSRQGALREK
jgi:hypothetical protein